MSTPLVSVIMPVYNVEKYVGRAIESLLAQTMPDFELWLVDDGTKDNSGVICDEYAARDARITVVHKENGGAPSARNYAIERARGKYLYFMDSDDWTEPTMLADMTALAEQHGAQCVVTGYYIDTYYREDAFVTQKNACPDAVYPTKEAFRQACCPLFDHNLLYTPWNKLYLHSYIREHGLRFPQTFWDDFPFNLSVLREIERVVVSEKAYYHFLRARADSETAKYVAAMYDKREEEQGWMEELFACWGLDTAESREFLARRYMERWIGCVENITNRACTLNRCEKRETVRRMLDTDRVKKYLPVMQPRSTKMRLMLLPVRWHNITLILAEGRVISWVKTHAVKWFARLKAER